MQRFNCSPSRFRAVLVPLTLALSLHADPADAQGLPSEQALALAAFAKANEGKFAKEISGLPKTFVLRIHGSRTFELDGRYDPAAETWVADLGFMLSFEASSWRQCKTVGSFVGRNAFGATVRVTHRNCTELVIGEPYHLDKTWGELKCDVSADASRRADAEALCKRFPQRVATLKMTPEQFRGIKGNGPVFEVDFDVGASVSGEVVEVQHGLGEPTHNDPFEDSVTRHIVYGTIVRARLLTGDGQTQIGEFVR